MSVKVLLEHHPNDAAFADALSSLLSEVLGLADFDILVAPEPIDHPPSTADEVSPIAVLIEILSQYRATPHRSVPGTDAETLRVRVLLDGLRPEDCGQTSGWMTVDGGSTFALEELLGSAAGRLGVMRALDLMPHRQRFEQLAVLGRGKSGEHQSAVKNRVRAVYAGAFGLLGLATYCWVYPPWGHGRFEFEQPDHGWQQERGGPRACRGVSRSDDARRRGSYSLELDMDLDPAQPERHAGEAWIDLSGSEGGPLDLSNRRVTAWVYAPLAAAGSPERPNGYQLFVKDVDYNSHYGPWVNAHGDTWTEVELQVGQSSEASLPGPGFDATKVRIVGIKMALGTPPQNAYTGPVYLDSVDW